LKSSGSRINLFTKKFFEHVQGRLTEILPGLQNLSHAERLKLLILQGIKIPRLYLIVAIPGGPN